MRCDRSSGASLPSEVTACSWDPNNSGVLGLCGADGSFVLARHESGIVESPGRAVLQLEKSTFVCREYHTLQQQ